MPEPSPPSNRQQIVLRSSRQPSSLAPGFIQGGAAVMTMSTVEDPFGRVRAVIEPISETFPPRVSISAPAEHQAASEAAAESALSSGAGGPPFDGCVAIDVDAWRSAPIWSVPETIVDRIAEQACGLADRRAGDRVISPVALDPADDGARALAKPAAAHTRRDPVILARDFIGACVRVVRYRRRFANAAMSACRTAGSADEERKIR